MSELTVRFFAHLREELGRDSESVAFEEATLSVEQVIRRLCAEHGEPWITALGDQNLVIAINQCVSSREAALHAGDELAIYPPVTGG